VEAELTAPGGCAVGGSRGGFEFGLVGTLLLGLGWMRGTTRARYVDSNR